MSTATANIHAEAVRIANEVFGTRPTADEIDALAQRYLDAKAAESIASANTKGIEAECLAVVKDWGVVPAGAEKSRRLNGRLAELTVTKSDTITVNAERVETLREMLYVNGHVELFPRLFATNTKYEIVDGAETVLKEVAVAKRLGEKILNFFGRCITVKAKKPSLKVVIADPAKPAKKSRAKKGGA